MKEIVQWLPYITSRVRRRVGYRNDYEDILQDVLLFITRKYHKYDPEKGAFSNWVTHVIRSAVSDSLDRRNQRKVKMLVLLDTINARYEVDGTRKITPIYHPTVLEDIDRAREIKQLRGHINSLKGIGADRLSLQVFEDLDYEDIAERTGASVGAVKESIRQGRLQIQKKMKKGRLR